MVPELIFHHFNALEHYYELRFSNSFKIYPKNSAEPFLKNHSSEIFKCITID